VPYACHHYGLSFLMGDFLDETGWGKEAHLFFTPEGSVESFPLPEGYRRWIVQSCMGQQTGLPARVRALCGHDLSKSDSRFESEFSVQRLLCKTYTNGNTVLCGDAAHLMSPVGGQGMNTGFCDAKHLSEVLAAVFQRGADAHSLLLSYSRLRKKAFNVAANRAAMGMRMGTLTGNFRSALRSFFLSRLLVDSALYRAMPAYFSMLTIPRTSVENEESQKR